MALLAINIEMNFFPFMGLPSPEEQAQLFVLCIAACLNTVKIAWKNGASLRANGSEFMCIPPYIPTSAMSVLR
jgi:hypothetical protein